MNDLYKVKQWCFSRKKQDDNTYHLIIEEEDPNSEQQLFEVEMNFENGKAQIFFVEDGERLYLTTERKQKVEQREWTSYLDGPICIDYKLLYFKYRVKKLKRVNGFGLKMFFEKC